jgi:hypothetical protein
MAETPPPTYQYDVSLSTGPFREPGKDVLSYDFFINRKGWLIPRVMRVFVDVKSELDVFQRDVLQVSGGSPGQQLKLTQTLTRLIADQKVAIMLADGRIEKASEVLVPAFTAGDGHLFLKLQDWMLDVKERVRQEIKATIGL